MICPCGSASSGQPVQARLRSAGNDQANRVADEAVDDERGPIAVSGTGDPPHGAPMDEAVIEQLASITDGQGFSVLSELLNAFLDAVPARLDALHRAVDKGDLPAVADQAHVLTGSSASFGARRMADLCRDLRSAAQGGDEARTRSLVAGLRSEFGEVRSWLIDFGRMP